LRKVMLLAAMLAMVLVAAAPAFAQVAIDNSTDTQYSDSFNTTTFCNQVGGLVLANQGQYGDAGAAATDNSAAAADIAQQLGVSQDQVLNCFSNLDTNGDGTITTVDTTGGGTSGGGTASAGGGSASASAGGGSASASAGSAASASAGSAAAASGGTLPDTGGASLIALGAGALLVAGGLLARRIVR